jgi:hypothetical protein
MNYHSMALILIVMVGTICSIGKKFIFKVHFVFFVLFFSNKYHKTSKYQKNQGFFFVYLFIYYCCSMSTMLTRSTRRQLDEMLQKNVQVRPFGG